MFHGCPEEGWAMQRGGTVTQVRRKTVAVALVCAVVTAAMAPMTPNGVGRAAAQGSTGTIVHSADGVLLRAEPAFGAEVLTTLDEGARVALRTTNADTVSDPDGVTQWWPIASGETEGWVAGFYLDVDGLTTAPAAPVAEPDGGRGGEDGDASAEDFLSTWDLTNAAAKVSEPEGINLRQDPGASSPALKTLLYETVLDLRIDELDTVYTEGSRWWPVQVDGLVGWVSGA